MKRYGQTIRLRPDGKDGYIQHHAAVWPGVLEKIKDCNISNYSIFVKDLVMFAYFEYNGTDFIADMNKMAAHKKTQKWWSVVKPLMDPIETREEGEFWANMEEIFHMN